jgi:hypothetical protein
MPQAAACAVLIFLSANAFCDGQAPSPAAQRNANIILYAEHFGVIGDGTTDDGPAIQRAVAELCRQDEPATLRFEAGRTYRAKQVDATRLFRLEDCQDITIDGGGSTFLLDGDVRFALIQGARNVRLRNLSVDYDPLPFVDGLITKKSASERHVDIRVMDEFSLPPLGGPTRQGGEQAYFGMLWIEGRHSLIGHHFYVLDMQEAYPGSLDDRIVRVFTDFKRFDLIEENVHAISLPVRGIAHRCMDGATIRIAECENVQVENVNVWSAPWFAFQVFRNKGTMTFRHVDIRPKPNSNRRSSSWRDGFHVKGNRADLLFESCHLEGMNDDAFNISTHMSRVVKVVSPTEVQVQQVYPLEIVPFEPGDEITFYSLHNGQITAPATLDRCDGKQDTEYLDNGRPRAPILMLHLAEPVADLQPGDRLWNGTSANPNTVIRDCKICNSCRFQSPVTIEECEITAFTWYHSENVEGPIPSRVVIRDSILRLGRGNPVLAASFDGSIAIPNRSPTAKRHPAIEHVLLQGNTIDGQVRFARIKQLELQGNHFLAPRSKLHFSDCKSVTLKDNRLGSERLDHPSQLELHDPVTRAGIAIDNDGKVSGE